MKLGEFLDVPRLLPNFAVIPDSVEIVPVSRMRADPARQLAFGAGSTLRDVPFNFAREREVLMRLLQSG
jgi:hypothetical protein